MALSTTSLKSKMIANLKAQGFKVDESHCMMNQMADAIAVAIIEEITTNAQAQVVGGSSSGPHKII